MTKHRAPVIIRVDSSDQVQSQTDSQASNTDAHMRHETDVQRQQQLVAVEPALETTVEPTRTVLQAMNDALSNMRSLAQAGSLNLCVE